MCLEKGQLITETISNNTSDYPLLNKLQINFVNLGCGVLIDGDLVANGESYVINVPNVIITNGISIQFQQSANRKLRVKYVLLIE